MCKYCQQNKKYLGGEPLYFKHEGLFISKKNEDKKIAVIENHKETFNDLTLNKGWIITLCDLIKDEKYGEWYDLKINYCPMCGKKLRKELIRY